MRISHKYKFVFLSKWKCASESIRDALGPFSDIDSSQRYPYYHHTNAKALQGHFEIKGWDWDSYYSFITVRNPWNMLASLYFYGLPDSSGKYYWNRNWDAILNDYYLPEQRVSTADVIPFTEWIKTYDLRMFTLDFFIKNDYGKTLVDDVFLVEKLESSFASVAKKLKLPASLNLPKRNSVKHPTAGEVFTEETVDIVADIFASDVEAGAYSPPKLRNSSSQFYFRNIDRYELERLNLTERGYLFQAYSDLERSVQTQEREFSQRLNAVYDANFKAQEMANSRREELDAVKLKLKQAEEEIISVEDKLRRADSARQEMAVTLKESEQALEAERIAKAQTTQDLEAERAAHAQTTQALEAARVVHAQTTQALEAERVAKAQTTQDLEAERAKLQGRLVSEVNLKGQIYEEREARKSLAIAVHAYDALQRSRFWTRWLGPKIALPSIPPSYPFEETLASENVVSDLMISVITPSYNSGDCIEKAIKSVMSQKGLNWEHIVVDGGSTDGTLEILKRYEHIRWISEPDRGQVDAMNKGFAMSKGDIIVYLNADDYFLEGAFSAVVSLFERDTMIVYGNVDVYDEQADHWWTNKPRFDFHSILKHWELDAFCVNPVGYFYRREVQEAVPFKEENGAKMDLAFLMEAAYYFEKQTKKTEATLGVFMNTSDTQTVREQTKVGYWTPENFSFIDSLIKGLPEEFKSQYRAQQKEGYKLREQYTASSLGKEVIYLPSTEHDMLRSDNPREVDVSKYPLREGDTVVVVLTYGKVGSISVSRSLYGLVNDSGAPVPVYHLHSFFEELPQKDLEPYDISGHALRQVFEKYRDKLNWKFIFGVREFVSLHLSAYFQNEFLNQGPPTIEELHSLALTRDEWVKSMPRRFYQEALGIDLFAHHFDKEKGYSIINEGTVSILVYRFDKLNSIFTDSMKAFMGIDGISLPHLNTTKEKDVVVDGESMAECYARMKKEFRLPRKDLEEIYSDSLAVHYFSECEINELIEKWSDEGRGDKSSVSSSGQWEGVIYDVGLHAGEDTEFYLKKGFQVVAVDANPAVIESAHKRFGKEVQSGQLVLLNVGIVEQETGEKLTFYVNENRSEWSSFVKKIALRDGAPHHTVEVDCRSLASITNSYGFPYYVKIDIEGHDHLALKSLMHSGIHPKYLSVENGNAGMLKYLHESGYTEFKYIQQRTIPRTKLTQPALEGVFVDFEFPQGSSGPFGEETPGQWLNYDEARNAVAKVWDPDGYEKNPNHLDSVDGWFDLHAKYSAE